MSVLILIGNKITWNVGDVPDDELEDEIVHILVTHRPMGMTLQEVGDRRDVLAQVCLRTGYHLVQEKGGAGHNAELLSPEAELHSNGKLLLSSRKWVGKKVAGARKSGMARANDLTFVRYRYAKLNWIDGNIHAVPSHQVRLARLVAVVQFGRALTWLWTRQRIATLSGDFNHTLKSKWRLLKGFERIAFILPDDGRGTHGGRGIDFWMFLKRQTIKLKLRYTVTVLEGYSSDHKPVKVTIKRMVKS